VVDRFVSVPMILSDLERRDARGQIFRWISLITLVLFDLERPNSAGYTCGGWAYFYGVSYVPTARGRGPSAT